MHCAKPGVLTNRPTASSGPCSLLSAHMKRLEQPYQRKQTGTGGEDCKYRASGDELRQRHLDAIIELGSGWLLGD